MLDVLMIVNSVVDAASSRQQSRWPMSLCVLTVLLAAVSVTCRTPDRVPTSGFRQLGKAAMRISG